MDLLAVDVTTNPKVTFSEAMAPTSITKSENGSCAGSVQLSDNNTAGCVNLDLALSSGGNVLTITPVADLDYTTQYTLRLTQDLTDRAGNPLASEFLSNFTTADNIAGLGDTASARLRSNLESILTSSQIDTILDAASAKLAADGLSGSEDPSSVLPSFLAGSMTGIGQASLGNDALTTQAISTTTSTITSLIGEFEDKLVTAFRLARQANEQAAFENLLALLIETAVGSLTETGLSTDALDDGFGEVVGAVISSLDEANTEASEISAAVQVVTKKAVQKVASVAGMNATSAIQSATKSAIKGLGNTNLSTAQVTATLSVTVKTVVDSLDEVEGSSSLDLGTVVVQVTESSIAGLADLQQTFANDASFQIGDAVKSIAKGAVEGSGNWQPVVR